MKWLLKRVAAGVAALLVVVVAAGALLGMRFSGDKADWAAGAGGDAAWLSGEWLTGERGAGDRDTLKARVERAGIGELYVLAGTIGADGTVEGAGGSEEAADFLAWAAEELPDVRVLAWLRHRADGSSLVEDRFDEEGREELSAAAGSMAGAGFAGVHLDVAPVSVNDPSYPVLLESVREEIGDDAVLSVQALPVELVPGLRVPYFAIDRGERYWSKGYLRRVAERADVVVIPGHGSGMPVGSMYGGYMVRQVEEAAEALDEERVEDTAVRFGIPAYEGEEWGPESGSEDAATALEAVRIGMTKAGAPRMRDRDAGVALYLLDTASDEEWDAYVSEWVEPSG
ncbi:hypothetical protein [Nocardiopsis suaedae]|uniref:Uncharacterized protein n=1 Tax=Nocardiopsis suaedae TaxID=3018444 RepID=A0ABT4TDY6_9ACTN|nr:hypothetical protein [Nocardiopsis suaedae]MDA2802930.1 hypothetical protein [Nocardiopsis suaedae]